MSDPASTAQAVAVGNEMAERVISHRRKAEADRREFVRSRLPETGLEAAAPKAARSNLGVIVAEGDSWFDYPFNDVLKDLEDDYGYEVESVAHKGDRVEDMAYSDGQRDDFTRRIQKVLRRGDTIKAILLSGGGNDIAGDEFALLLNHAASGIAGLNESVVRGVIDERIADAYTTILTSVTRVCEEIAGRRIPILVHGYDYAVPDGRGVLGGFWVLPGPWLEPGFRQKGYGAMATRQALINQLMDRFNTLLAAIAARPGFDHVRYVDLRGTLRGDASYKEDWANELHPTGKGFAAVTRRFAAAI